METNTIHFGGCLEGMQKLPDKSIDMILCDPPYGVADCRWDKVINPAELFNAWFRLIKDNGTVIITAIQPFATDMINAGRKYFRYDLIWRKTSPLGFPSANKRPLRDHELILVFYKHQPIYNPQELIRLEKPVKKQGKKLKDGKESVYRGSLDNTYYAQYTNYPRSVLTFSNANNRGGMRNIHPTQKPVELFEYLIRTYTNAGDVVLDSCMGSGTTAIAALNTGRRYIGYEADEVYHKAACERIAKHIIV